MRFVFVSGMAVVAISALCLYGWGSATLFLQSLILNAPEMTPITAMVLLGFGVVLIIASSMPNGHLQGIPKKVCLIIPVVAALTGLWTLGEYLLPGLPSIDLILFRDALLHNGGRIPGRSSPHSAVCFVLMGIAFLLLIPNQRQPKWAGLMVITLAVFGLGISLLVVVGYLTNTREIFALPSYARTGMSLMTAVSFTLIGFGMVRLQRSWNSQKRKSSLAALPIPES